MSADAEERLVERLVTYTLAMDGDLVVVEHVPARINEETGERYYAPATVEKLQQIIRERRQPKRVIEAPVFDFAA